MYQKHLIIVWLQFGFVLSQFLPPLDTATLIRSHINPKVTINYREPAPGTCETVFSHQKQYTGYITLPPFTLAPIQQNYTINTFFWFIEARTNSSSAPLTIFMNGGPGSSSLIGLFEENGPCEVQQLADGSYGTVPRLWGWDRSSNMIYIDQPVQTGLSYDVQHNLTRDFRENSYSEPVFVTEEDQGPASILRGQGTFASQDERATANTTAGDESNFIIAAEAVWHFLQSFLSTFPAYNSGSRPDSNVTESTSVHLFAESYGGIMGPILSDLFETKNNLPATAGPVLEIKLSSLGIINGMIDRRIQMPFYPRFANNNTYGIAAIDLTTTLNALAKLTSPGGCDELIARCRAALVWGDPAGSGSVASVNDACSVAQQKCDEIVTFWPDDRSLYDITQKHPSPFPSSAYVEYLNTREVQQSIGAAVNYTKSSPTVFAAYAQTGDINREDPIRALTSLLNRGVRVSLIYGDADYMCNWFGGEAVARALAESIPAYSAGYRSAGYAEVVVNSSYIGGAVKQYGNLSFVRVYDAGHLVPSYQPETAFTIFARIIQGTSISTGAKINTINYQSLGPSQSQKMNKMPASLNPVCWVRLANSTCSSQQIDNLVAGRGAVLNGVYYQRPGDYLRPPSSVIVGKPGAPLPTLNGGRTNTGAFVSGAQVTGVYTATVTPKLSLAAKLARWSFGSMTSLLAAHYIFI